MIAMYIKIYIEHIEGGAIVKSFHLFDVTYQFGSVLR